MTEKTPAKRAAKGRKQPDWNALATKSSTAPKEELEREDAEALSAEQTAPTPVKRRPRTLLSTQKKAKTFRLPPDCFDKIAEAKEDAALRAEKLTDDDIAREAIRDWHAKWKRRNKQANENASE